MTTFTAPQHRHLGCGIVRIADEPGQDGQEEQHELGVGQAHQISNAFEAALSPGGTIPTLGLVYTVVMATLVGSGIWTWLISRHPAGVVAPFSLLVPVLVMASAWLVLGEMARLGEMAGATLVIVGVLIGTLPPTAGRLRRHPHSQHSS